MLVCIGINKVSYKSTCNPKRNSSSTTIIKKKNYCFLYLITYSQFLPWRYWWSLHWSTIFYIFAFLNIFLFCLQTISKRKFLQEDWSQIFCALNSVLCAENFEYSRFVASEHLFLFSSCFTELLLQSGGLTVRGIYIVWYFNSNEGLKIRTSPL